MRVLLNKRAFITFFLVTLMYSPLAKSNSKGIAIDPLEIKVKGNKVSYFTVYNDTDHEYIITQKVVSDNSDGLPSKRPFVVNPPIRLIKERSYETLGLIYLQDNNLHRDRVKYYLSIKFIPKNNKEKHSISIPIVLEQLIPITLFE